MYFSEGGINWGRGSLMNMITEKCIQLMNSRFTLDISRYDHSFLEKAIQNRMASAGCQTDENYLIFLEEMPGESISLLAQLNNSYSEFFRNPLTFSLLEQLILPKLFNQKEKIHSPEIRIWSAGCASGQEPYSLAILLDDYKEKHKVDSRYRIFATDSSENELVSARKGVFDFKVLKNTRIEFAEKYFKRNGDTFLLDSRLGVQVDFSRYDLLSKDSSSPPSGIYGDYDLIMCCNVLFYYEPEYQQIILQKIYRSLKPGGFFVTGEAETHLANAFGGFRLYVLPSAIFIKN
jgi:chemotaxis methyl-accepting protein methylase